MSCPPLSQQRKRTGRRILCTTRSTRSTTSFGAYLRHKSRFLTILRCRVANAPNAVREAGSKAGGPREVDAVTLVTSSMLDTILEENAMSMAFNRPCIRKTVSTRLKLEFFGITVGGGSKLSPPDATYSVLWPVFTYILPDHVHKIRQIPCLSSRINIVYAVLYRSKDDIGDRRGYHSSCQVAFRR
jgi:hypothetical protein